MKMEDFDLLQYHTNLWLPRILKPIFYNLLVFIYTLTVMQRRLLGAEVSLPLPKYGNETSDSYLSDPDFETNMVVILAALLCALICTLGLSSIVRYARCCRGGRFAPETREQAAARLATVGLEKRELQQIPVAVYGTGLSFTSTECPICLGEFEDGEKVRVLPKCNHGFHVRCIDTWLVSHSSCPNCRHSLLEYDIQSTEISPEVRARRSLENLLGDHQHSIVVVGVQAEG